jgi:hypothetical protein
MYSSSFPSHVTGAIAGKELSAFATGAPGAAR